MATYIDPLDNLITGNRRYIQHTTEKDPNAFSELAKGQAPEILWIGCADSRVPETTVCNGRPGDIFVHRNIANTVHANDVNSASVVEYAVAHLKVNKVVVCGLVLTFECYTDLASVALQHTKCGGAAASLGDADLGVTLNSWLHPIRELRRKHRTELERLIDDDARATRVAELNVQQSIEVLKQHPAIRRAISERGLTLHGLIYDIGAGHLKVLDGLGSKKTIGLWNPN